jgi:hypothetical protein
LTPSPPCPPVAKLNPERQPEIHARLADPDRRRAVTILTAIIGLTFAIDGGSQIALALTVPTGTFVADSTAARIVVLGTGLIVTTWHLRHQKERLDKRRRPPAQGPFEESVCYRDFMGWDMPWYSAQPSIDALLTGRRVGMFHLVCYLREGDKVFETYWTNGRGVEAMDNSYALLDLTVYGRQEPWEDSPAGWPQQWHVGRSVWRTNGRPTAQWSRIQAGRSDDLGNQDLAGEWTDRR